MVHVVHFICNPTRANFEQNELGRIGNTSPKKRDVIQALFREAWATGIKGSNIGSSMAILAIPYQACTDFRHLPAVLALPVTTIIDRIQKRQHGSPQKLVLQ